MLKKIVLALNIILISCAPMQQRQKPLSDKQGEPQQAVQKNKARDIAVIFGPGGLKTMAQIGVLKNMEAERFQIKKVEGLEWGAAIASVYARKGKVNDLEWQMAKLTNEHLPKPGFFKNNIDLENPNRLNLFFEKVFQAHNLANNALAFSCPTATNRSGRIAWLNSGPAYKELKKCIAYPPLFYSYNGWRAEPFALQEAIEQIRQSGDYTIIYIDVLAHDNFSHASKTLDQETEKILWQKIQQQTKEASKLADYYIAVDTSSHDFLDLSGLRKMITEGQQQTEASVKSIAKEIYGTL